MPAKGCASRGLVQNEHCCRVEACQSYACSRRSPGGRWRDGLRHCLGTGLQLLGIERGDAPVRHAALCQCTR